MNIVRAAGHGVVTTAVLIFASTLTMASQTYVLRSGSNYRSTMERSDRSFDSEALTSSSSPFLIDSRYAIDDPDDPDSASASSATSDRPVHSHSRPHHSRRYTQAVDIARTKLGTRYIWGGTTSRGFDCSGFVRYVYAKLGRNLPRTASEQFHCGAPVHYNDMKPGDVLFFHTSRPGVSHVGIYIGHGRFIHAANPRKGVVTTDLSGYYARRLLGARRMP